MRGIRLQLVVAATLLASVGWTAAENIAAPLAYHLHPDGTPLSDQVFWPGGPGPVYRWYVIPLVGGRSYSFQTLADYSSPQNDRLYTALMAFYAADAKTRLDLPANGQSHPQAFTSRSGTPLVGQPGGQRVSYTSTVAYRENLFVQVYPDSPSSTQMAGDFVRYRISVQDTTLYAPWFATTDRGDTLVHVQNVTDWPVTFTLTHYAAVSASNGTPAVVGTPYSFILRGFAGTTVQSKGQCGIAPGQAGSLKITHDGPPGAIKAVATSEVAGGVGSLSVVPIEFSTMGGAQTLR